MGKFKNKPNDIVYDFYEVNQNGKPAPVEDSPLNFLGAAAAFGGASRGALKYMRGGSPGGSSSSGGTHSLGTPQSRVNRKGAAMSSAGMNVPEGDRIDPMTARDNMMASMTASISKNGGGDAFAFAAKQQEAAKTPEATVSPSVPLNGHQASQMNAVNAAPATEEGNDPVKGTGGVTAAVNIPTPPKTPTIPEQGGSSPATGSGKRYILTEE